MQRCPERLAYERISAGQVAGPLCGRRECEGNVLIQVYRLGRLSLEAHIATAPDARELRESRRRSSVEEQDAGIDQDPAGVIGGALLAHLGNADLLQRSGNKPVGVRHEYAVAGAHLGGHPHGDGAYTGGRHADVPVIKEQEDIARENQHARAELFR